MKQWQCCILQLCDSNGDPFTGALCYSLFLNNLNPISSWIATAEINKEGIFHVHALLQTSQRSDSVRRTMNTVWQSLNINDAFTQRFGQDTTMDCLKLQRCYKPSSMFAYIMKKPIWVLSNTERLLQLCFDVNSWKLNARFQQNKENESPSTSPDMNTMTKEIVDIIIANNCKSFEECLRADPQTMSKYLHRPGLMSVIQNCLTFVKATGGGWSLKLFDQYEPRPDQIHKCLLFQGILPSEFDYIFFRWITKQDSKRNTIIIQGPSNTGKSAFLSGLKLCIPWGEIVNTNSFAFEGLIDSVMGCWEEPLCSSELAEKAKQVLEGMPTSIPVKFKKPHLLPRTPIFITTNHNLWRFCQQEEEMFRNRCWIFWFNYQCKDSPYFCRTCEYSCECYCCTASRSGSSPDGESSSCRVQRENEPLFTGEHGIIRTDSGRIETENVWTGSMCRAGEGISRGYDCTSGCCSSSTEECSTNTTRPAVSSSSTIERNMGCRSITGSIHTDNGNDSSESNTKQYVESNNSTRSNGSNSSGNGNRGGKHKFKRKHTRGNGTSRKQSIRSNQLGLLVCSETFEETIPIQTKQSRLDREMGTITNPMTVPSKQDWQQYLRFLTKKYGSNKENY